MGHKGEQDIYIGFSPALHLQCGQWAIHNLGLSQARNNLCLEGQKKFRISISSYIYQLICVVHRSDLVAWRPRGVRPRDPLHRHRLGQHTGERSAFRHPAEGETVGILQKVGL